LAAIVPHSRAGLKRWHQKESDVKDSLRPGLTRLRRITIDRERTIRFMGEEARVYATPRLVIDIEYTCRELIIGMEIALKHLAPSLSGTTVAITAKAARRSAASA
jgi:fluoroacetyl-CoA thioesterase